MSAKLKNHEENKILIFKSVFAITNRKYVATKETFLGYLNAPLTLTHRKLLHRSPKIIGLRHFSAQKLSKMVRIH